jgi:CAAX prenyl protease-like protein
MSDSDNRAPVTAGSMHWVDRLMRAQPEAALMGPFMVYLLLLGLGDRFPEHLKAIPIVIRGVGGLWAVWIVRKHLPAMGRPHLLLALLFGMLAAAGWVGGQHLFNAAVEQLGLAGKWYIFKLVEPVDPRLGLGAANWWTQAVLRIGVAVITVPIVEELFWRAFMLRAFIDWNRWQRVPLGTFTWFSFLGTSLISVLQHPSNWAVSIFCWMLFNALFYWKKSIFFLILVHAVTNLVLYVYVIACRDWIFW